VVLHDLNEFFRLSAALNYQLSAAGVGRASIIETILDGRQLPAGELTVLEGVLAYLERAYSGKQRRLGPLAVLHPLRATALLARAQPQVNLLDLLTELLHDKFEDILESDFPQEEWQALEGHLAGLLRQIDPSSEWYLMERLDVLTRRPDGETYYHYIGRVLDRAPITPELVRVKLADRLDNTLDMRIDFRDPLEGVDFFAVLFRTMLHQAIPAETPSRPHPQRAPLDGARRLYELFKNTVVLSLVRQRLRPGDDATVKVLFDAIATASMREAQRVVLHLFTYHVTETSRQHQLLAETLAYCRSGGISAVTRVNLSNRLDGLFLERFDAPSSQARQRKLEELYADKDLMVAAALAFIVIFMNFRDDPEFLVRGVTPAGISPS
jgi:hypothetical protein